MSETETCTEKQLGFYDKCFQCKVYLLILALHDYRDALLVPAFSKLTDKKGS